MALWKQPTPATLLLGAMLLSIGIACLPGLTSASIAFGTGCMCLLICRPKGSTKRILAANIFLLMMWLIVPFTTPGKEMARIGIISASREGILICILITLKANAILVIFCSFLSGMTSIKLAAAMRQLFIPAKLIWLVLLMERNIVMLGREWRKLEESAKLRCFSPKTDLRSYRTLAIMLGILLLFAQARAKRAQEAMLLAGFDGTIPFNWPWKFGLSDLLLLLLVAIMIGAIYAPMLAGSLA